MQLCPALARIVRLDKDYILDYTPTAPVPMASEEEDYLIEGDEEEDSGFSLFEGGAPILSTLSFQASFLYY